MVQLLILKLKTLIKQLNGVRKNMAPLKKIDNIANLWEKTKDPKYKNLWYQLVKEFANGPNNIKRRTVSTTSSDKRNNAKHKIIKQPKLF